MLKTYFVRLNYIVDVLIVNVFVSVKHNNIKSRRSKRRAAK